MAKEKAEMGGEYEESGFGQSGRVDFDTNAGGDGDTPDRGGDLDCSEIGGTYDGEHESETEGETEPESGEGAGEEKTPSQDTLDNEVFFNESSRRQEVLRPDDTPVIDRVASDVASPVATSGKPTLRLVAPPVADPKTPHVARSQPQVAATSGQIGNKALTGLPPVNREVVETEWRVEWRTVSADSAPLMARLWLRVGGKWLKATRALVAEHQIDVAGPLIFEIHSATAAEAASIKRIGDERIKRHLKEILNRGSRQRNARVS